MSAQLEVCLDFNFIRRYRKFGVDINHLSELYPLVVRHRNIVDYILGANPEVVTDRHEIAKAMKKWKAMIDTINTYGVSDALPSAGFVIGFYYPNIYVVSSRLPEIPHVPDWVGVVVENEPVIVKKSDVQNMRRLYVEILKVVSRAVIVNPVL